MSTSPIGSSDATGTTGYLRPAPGGRFDLGTFPPATVRRRVERRMPQREASSAEEYAQLLRCDPAELLALEHECLASGRVFFRDRGAWSFLAHEVVPAIVRPADGASGVRVWVPYCGAGAEAYAIAMLLLEHRAATGAALPVRVFASDADEASLAVVRAGTYPWIVASAAGPARLDRFFTASGYRYQINPELRRSIVFAQHDLLSDLPFSHIDLVCCRDLFPHLRPSVRERATSMLRHALREGGHLVLGAAEALPIADGFERVSRRWSMYRRVATASDGGCAPREDATVRPVLGTAGGAAAVVEAPAQISLAPFTSPDLLMLRLVAMGQLAASLAHELRQPLAATANLLEACAIRMQSGEAGSRELLPLLRQAGAQSLRAGRIVGHIARLLRNDGRRRRSRDVRRLLVTAAALTRPMVCARGITLRVATTTERLRVQVCSVEIEQVLVNLIQNAADAIGRGTNGGHVITLEARRAAGQVEVVVADTGGGMSDDVAARMFDPFFTTKSDGLGLGLAICQSIVSAHGGRLWTVRTAGDGFTRMCFTLPLNRAGDGSRCRPPGQEVR